VKVRFLPRSYDDIDRLHAFLSPKTTKTADRVVDLLYESALSLRTAPERGRPLARGFRELIVPFGKAAYVLRYRIDKPQSMIFIARIWHSREHR